jgi:glutaconyl-CoA/methylmalonyl-CoA decarboxylase subunit gamma
MRYYVSLDATTSRTVSVSERPGGELDVRLGEEPVDVDVVWLDGVASVRVGGRVVDLVVEGSPPDLALVASGRRAAVRVESDRQRAAAAAQKVGGGHADKVLKAPMPGRVVRVLVAAGDSVDAGATLCVIEAMKMENEVKSKAAAKVLEVRVVEGATVEAGAKLFTLS